jgi:hypothetical protein
LDDVGLPNFQDFEIFKQLIYPGNLILTKSNEDSSSNNVAYLDLSISVSESDFVIKVYCKTDDYDFTVVTLPFLESNVAEEMCYSVFFGQILRFLRICSKLEDFIERAKFLADNLIGRNYIKKKLATKLNQVLFRYQKDWNKFPVRMLPHELTRQVLFQ